MSTMCYVLYELLWVLIIIDILNYTFFFNF